LTLPPEMRVHPTFHVSLIKPYHGSDAGDGDAAKDVPAGPVTWSSERQPFYSVERILDYRVRRVRAGRRFRNVHEYLVKWAGYSSEHNSWEPQRNFTPDLSPVLQEARERAKAAAGTLRPEG
ncbi:hypothetical protein Vafri_11448, partial [Volvox africanus]